MIALLLLLAARGADEGAPLPRYLDAAELLRVVVADGVPAWQSCLDAGEAGGLGPEGVPFRVVVAPDGSVRSVEAPGASDCLVRAARGLRWHPHDEDEVAFRFRLAAAGGRVLSPVAVELEPRPALPAFLLLPAELPQHAWSALWRAMSGDGADRP